MLARISSLVVSSRATHTTQVREYAKNPKDERTFHEKPKHIPSIEEVRRRALMKKDAAKMKQQVQESAMDPLIRQAYDELEDEDRMARGLPPIHAHKYARKRGVGARKGRKKPTDNSIDRGLIGSRE